MCVINVGSIALSGESKLTTGCGYEIYVISKAHNFCLMYKKIPSSKNNDGFYVLVGIRV